MDSNTQDVEFLFLLEDGSAASDPLTYPPWDPDTELLQKHLVCTSYCFYISELLQNLRNFVTYLDKIKLASLSKELSLTIRRTKLGSMEIVR